MEIASSARMGWRTVIVAFAVHILFCGLASGGGGPENVALVVNEDSWASLTVARQYLQLRQIPARNVIYLSDPSFTEPRVSIDKFRDAILLPVIQEVGRRGLHGQIDYVVYSADFPFAVNVRPDLTPAEARSLPKHITTLASLNGLTYLYEAVLAKDWRTYLSLQSNVYANAQGRGFSSQVGWNSTGSPVPPPAGRRYMLSTVLAVTRGRGNSLDEVSDYLTRSAAADSTMPSGTIYLMKNDNVRSRTRAWAFDSTVQALSRLGIDARIENGQIPSRRVDVMGAVVGTARFEWSRSGNTILPGAICEHLTSFGGDLRPRASQTPLTEFLRHGAAGASGTVTEPYAIQAKFPTPLIHLSYASGCSLAESFYQSVAGPYQLLIVGDPLCRPWAQPPTVSVAGLRADQVVRGRSVLRVAARANHGVRRVELYLDGRRLGEYPPQFAFPVDTRSVSDGPHELRVVAVANDRAETRGAAIIPFSVANGASGQGGRREQRMASAGKPQVVHGSNLHVACRYPDAERIDILSGEKLMARVDGAAGNATVGTHRLGSGKVNLRVVAFKDGRPSAEQRLSVSIQVPTVQPLARQPDQAGLRRGLLLETRDGRRVVPDLSRSATKLGREQSFTIRAFFKAAAAGTYQVQFRPTAGVTSVRLNHHAIRLDPNATGYPVMLAAGWYQLDIAGTTGGDELRDIRLGHTNVRPLAADWMWCRSPPVSR